ncbi:MAG: septal ring lytic transglycosylase RlpA family protein [Pseudomonadota bacterium]|nr:septal ring lytic transglycosylase RlpA family protein [Pseudomonadota bacterium]
MRVLPLSLLAAVVLSGCTSYYNTYKPTNDSLFARYDGAAGYSAPRVTGKRKVGKPYKIMGKTYYPISSSEGFTEKGIASWYGHPFHGRKTANGEKYSMYEMTAAHPTLPLPTYARVTNLKNGRSVIVKINDRGPFKKNRVIDMSYRAAQVLDFAEQGVTPVQIEALPTDGSSLKTRHVSRTAPRVTHQKPVQPATTGGSFTSRVSTGAPVQKSPELVRDLAIGSTRYFVQTGAFTNEANAQKQLSMLKADFPSTQIFENSVNGTTYYRVRIGPVNTVDTADALLNNAENAGWVGARVVIE